MKHFILLFLILSTPLSFSQTKEVTNLKSKKSEKLTIKNLDDLLKEVRKDQIEQRPELKKRELKFLKSRNLQRGLLIQAKSELNREEQIMISLQSVFNAQEKSLSDLENRLTLVMGTLGELFGVVKQTSRSLKSQLETSVISAELIGREDFPKKIARRKELATTSELEKLWILIQQEMTESGKVSSFKREVVAPNGKKKEQRVTRIGSFNLVSKGKYLNYESETKQVSIFPKQVSRRFLSLIGNVEKAKKGYHAFGVDPSRGSLLALFMQSPNLLERINQGGLVGYVIILLLLFSLVFSGERFWKLRIQEKILLSQINANQILEGNPLGDIKKVFEENKNKSIEVLELKMEESISKKTSQVQKGLSTIKILASIAPLLGLLGTVTGMIATFQSITLFGTGDPKLMAGGISQALVTTVLGLVAAIPLVLIYNYLSTKAKNIIQIFEDESLGFLSEHISKK